jgi:hypothetical protein
VGVPWRGCVFIQDGVFVSHNPAQEGLSNTEDHPDPSVVERRIFRAQAEEHYLANQEKVVFPRFVSTRIFNALWVIALLLFILGLLITFSPLLESSLW